MIPEKLQNSISSKRIFFRLITSICLLLFSIVGVAQDSNIKHSIEELEHKLQHESFEIFRKRDARFQGDLTKVLIVVWPDGKRMRVKMKRAPRGGSAFNNEPRYEIAAYRLQKLFLEPDEYVVPPTVGRSLPLKRYHLIEPQVSPTFSKTDCVFFLFQYWLENVTSENIYDKKRFDSDSTYAKHLANMNILAHLIDHKDSNKGNFLVSSDPDNPRAFAVDNGVSFRSLASDRGEVWRKMRVKRVPRRTIERLKMITEEQMQQFLGVVAQYEIQNGQLQPVEPSNNLNEGKGIRRSGDIIQMGLTKNEIRSAFKRVQSLVKRTQSGKMKMF